MSKVEKKSGRVPFFRMRTADVSPRSSPLRDVSRGGTSATQRQKFHTNDADVPPRETSVNGDERGETSAVRGLPLFEFL